MFFVVCSPILTVPLGDSSNMDHSQSAGAVARVSDSSQLFLEINAAILSHADVPELLKAVAACLRREITHDFAAMSLYETETNQLRRYALGRPEDNPAASLIRLDGTLGGLAFRSRQPLLVGRIDYSHYPNDPQLEPSGVKSCCIVPVNSHGQTLGALGVGSRSENAFNEADASLLTRIASQVGIALENARNFQIAEQLRQKLAVERDRLQLLLDINNAVVSNLDLRSLMTTVASSLQKVARYEAVGLAIYDPEINKLRAYANVLPSTTNFIEEGQFIPLEGSIVGLCFTTGKPVLLDRMADDRFHSEWSKKFIAAGFKSGGCVPLIAHGRKLGTLGMATTRQVQFSDGEADLLCQVGNQIAIAVENALAYGQIEKLKNKLAEEKLYLEHEIRTEYNFEEIIGDSPALRQILKQLELVAPTDSTILIRGETGTGKELIARAIHNLSARRERTLVKVNCAAIPTGLLESELFGHERGAFTGAISQRVGRFELAHRGTLFLDEVGDIPLELQPKLLRVLQEQQFERLGSTRTQQVDVRLVAATNCDLEKMVGDKQYRSDLYYRLNVFPVTIPPLRDRREDIPLLVRFFAQRFARRMKKPIESIPAKTSAVLAQYHWPGNVRELENVIERAVILSKGSALEVPLSELKLHSEPRAEAKPPETDGLSTLEAIEREHILSVLAETKWVIAGPAGAAARLGMKRTTLQGKMRKLGISRRV
jgi:formate hydrogenlyase transcriptional activator